MIMKTKNKEGYKPIIPKIEKEVRDLCLDLTDREDISKLANILEENENINFCLEVRGSWSGDDYWLQAEYYSKKLGNTIIWDYHYPSSFESIDEFAETIMRTSSEICEWEKLITFDSEGDCIDK